MGERADRYRSEVKVLQLGFDLGMTLVDYRRNVWEGKAEILVGEAIAGRRERYLSGEQSLSSPIDQERGGLRLRTKPEALRTHYLDLYLLHWRGSIPLAEDD